MTRNPTWTGSGTNVSVVYADGYRIKVSCNDLFPSVLENKISAGPNVTFTKLNPGANEVIRIGVTPAALGNAVRASNTDIAQGFLDVKLNSTGLVSLTLQNSGGDEYFDISADLDGYLTYTKIDGYALKTDLNSYALRSSLDAYLTYLEIDGYALKTDLNSYALRSSLDAYLTYTEIDGYALKTDLNSYALRSSLDAYLTYAEIDGYALKTDLNSYALRSSLDAYLTYAEIDGYALRSSLDAYLTYLEIDGYALKTDLNSYALRSSLDAYLTYTEIDGYAKKDLLDAYLTYLEIDGYALKTDLNSYALRSSLDAYLTYLEIDGYALKTDLNSYALRSSLDAYLTHTEIDGYAKKDLLDAYLTFLDIDGYALKTDLNSYALRSSLDAYLTYTEIDGYAKKDLLDAYLTFLDIDGYQKTNATHIAYYTAYLATSNTLSLFTIKSADFSVAPANQPGTPSCVRMAFGTPWDGGDILITGIDARGSSTTETIGGATSGAIFGRVPWAYISNIQNTGHRTTGSVTGYYLYRIGLPHVKIEKPFAVYRNGVWDGVSASSGYSSTYGWVRPTTTPDGIATYLICYRYSEENDFDSD